MTKKTFKDFLMEDLDVFFNVGEFAEEHYLDDEPLLCIVVENRRDDKYIGWQRKQNDVTADVFIDHRTVYIKTEDYFVPQIGADISLDHQMFNVIDAAEEGGVIRIELSRNES